MGPSRLARQSEQSGLEANLTGEVCAASCVHFTRFLMTDRPSWSMIKHGVHSNIPGLFDSEMG